jgi:dTDP-glucose pyrophosphorylase
MQYTAPERNWRSALVLESATLKEAAENLTMSTLKICLIIDGDGRLIGTISDGDIRRGLLRGLMLASSIQEIVKKNPLVVPAGVCKELIRQIMAANQIQQIPEVDEKNRVLALHTWDEFSAPKSLANTMVIMAGGKGSRLRPHTEACPKPMLPVGGKPMLEHIVERAKLDGFSNFIFAVHYLGHMVEDYFGDGNRFNVKIEYLKEKEPLGTAGALSLLINKINAPFIVTNGDVITDIRYGELLDFHIRHDAMATMAVRLHEWQHPFGVVQMNGLEITGFEEKPINRTHINAGVYALNPSALNILEKNSHCDMPILFERLQAQSQRIVAYPMHEPWLDVGRPEDFLSISKQYINDKMI